MKTTPNEIQLLVRAIAFASEKHKAQKRKDISKTPYINHPIDLLEVLACEGNVTDIPTLCAAALHDTIEDTQTTAEELKSIFGDKITAIVLDLTDDKSLPKLERKEKQIEHAPHCLPEAKVVKIADKICNLRNILEMPPKNWVKEEKLTYFHWSSRVVNAIRGSHSVLEEVFDKLYERRNEF